MAIFKRVNRRYQFVTEKYSAIVLKIFSVQKLCFDPGIGAETRTLAFI